MPELIQISPEAVDGVKAVVFGANERMASVSQGIGGHAGTIGSAYNGTGTEIAMGTYDNLGQSGRMLAEALNEISQALGLTSNTGRETDDSAMATMKGVEPVSVSPDTSISAYI
ncbi:WXG100 family type VII secretion target [Streptomyces sp. 6N223]|uniref:WXG100 family type VII secretion target n=1 Tax=Streptomyces sp. 6N223 TaxID=3457412 RepID=UPI003FD5D9F5